MSFAAAVPSGPLTTPAHASRIRCRCFAGPFAPQRVYVSTSQAFSSSAATCLAPPQRPQQQQQQVLPRMQRQQSSRVLCRAEPEQQGEGGDVVYNKEFGYSRKDVLIIIVGLIALGVLMYEGLQAMGMDAGIAGNWVQATIFLGICVGWVSTYLWRVANKKMTYAQQLEMYESAVMQKRLEEMTEAELQALMAEVEADKAKLAAQREALRRQQQSSSSSGTQ